MLAGRVEGARHLHQAIRMRRTHDRAVISVAQRECVGNCVVEGQVGSRVVAHRERSLGRPLVIRLGVDSHERVHSPAVSALVLWEPVVRQIEGAVGQIGVHGVEVERQ